ncbi:MAG TPA: type I 3-dehydroquinate dehydratase [Thermoanaerobaculia bacterium]|nr:type I 3-dehydroquinate dehydratase [Thermoanaerobaculia bacterium]
MQLVATIYEPTQDAAIAAIRALPPEHDMVEVRFDAFGGGDPNAFHGVTSKPLLFTNRGGEPVDSDFGLIDVEFGRRIEDRSRTVLSFHDFNGMPALPPLIDEMSAEGCLHTKIAVTPATLRENEELLAMIRPGLTTIGMGERGLYSRILAPFFGSELFFAGNAAPGQLSLDRAIPIYGDRRVSKPEKIFAIAGNPAGHSLSPSIHNPLFRKAGVSAAYTIASFATFDEIAQAFERGAIAGLSVTAPFKDHAFAFAKRVNADVRRNAIDAEAVNTLVRTRSGIIAGNTDVTGFERLLPKAKRAAVLGAGGTARAALVALKRAGIEAISFNRTPRTGARPLDEVERFDGDLVIDTLPSGVRVTLPPHIPVIAAAYDRGGLQLLHEQALPQNELFLEAFR